MIRFAPLVLVLLAAPAAADERSFMLSGFERVRVEGPFEVEVTTGRSAAARAEGDRRALDAVRVEVEGSTLVVAPNVNGWGGYPGATRAMPKVTVTVPMLRAAAVAGGGRLSVTSMSGQRVALSLTGAGTIRVGEIDTDQLSASLIGTGALAVAGRAHDARFQTSGAGTIDAEGLSAGTLTVAAQSAGDSSFTARNTATIAALGNGTVRVSGPATCTVSGAAPVLCGNKPAR
ncbi:head GIN domain-containing protein [Sphingomonas sp. DT-204]|uniref:head GIN domain-containing protein n=1 Tax=Sphingomonas sp. DT-204 TaxID=3396166 RepID=UPI003F1B216F